MADGPFVSIVIPTYNRRQQVTGAIDSARRWLAAAGPAEIVVVDDASTDGTLPLLAERYADDIAAGRLRLHRLDANAGATGAKNAGAGLAQGEWLMFLDSDDRLVEDCAANLVDTLRRHRTAPTVFFRCRSTTTGQLIGAASSGETEISCRTYLRDWRWGECLPVVRSDAARRFPYLAALRGHEGISYARMMKHIAPCVLSPVLARLYDDAGTDRLSQRSALLKRAPQMAAGYWITLSEFPGELGALRFTGIFARWAYYRLACWSRLP